MSDSTKSVEEALLQAIKAERDGTQFYMMAARTCEDAKGKEIFELLAAEEVDHQRYLQIQYRSVQKTGKIDGTRKLGRRGILEGESPIFSPAIKARIGEAHFEMSALSIGIQLEQSAMAYYRQAADQAQDPEVKSLFGELADWESGHYNALLRQQELLRDDYWSTGGFSPF